jgi:hypothetical protein
MGIQTSIVKAGATGLTVVGGADLAFTPNGQPISSGIQVHVATDTDFRTRRHATFRSKQPQLLGNGMYSKSKQSCTFVQPKILADGSTVFNLVRVEVELHPESSVSEGAELRYIGGQLLTDSDFANFWQSGSLG